MYQLKYDITESDLKSVNSRIARFYYTLYFIVSLVGMGVGLAAIFVRFHQIMYIMGIALTALGGLLFLLALLLAVAPKSMIKSVVPVGEVNAKIDTDSRTIEVEAGGQTSEYTFMQVSRVKDYGSYILVYLGGSNALLVKDGIVSGQALVTLYSQLSALRGLPAYAPKQGGK